MTVVCPYKQQIQICFNYIITSLLNFNNDYNSVKVFLGYCHLLVWQIEILRLRVVRVETSDKVLILVLVLARKNFWGLGLVLVLGLKDLVLVLRKKVLFTPLNFPWARQFPDLYHARSDSVARWSQWCRFVAEFVSTITLEELIWDIILKLLCEQLRSKARASSKWLHSDALRRVDDDLMFPTF